MTGEETNIKIALDDLLSIPAADRLARLARHGPPEEVLLSLIEEAAKLALVHAERAIDATDMAIALADQLGCAVAQARARRAATRARAYGGRFDEALQAATDATEVARAAGLLDEVGRAQLAMMHPLIETGRVAEAIAAGRRAHDMFTEAGDAGLAARADINLGVVYQRSDDLDSAMECFDRARPHFDDDSLTRGHLDNNRGEALVALSRFDAAEQAFRDAQKAFESSDADLTAAIAESNLADLAVRRGRLSEALSYFEKARRRLELSQSITHLSRLLAEQADAHLLLGLPQDALVGYKAALAQLVDCGLALEAARARAGMGAALFRVGRQAEAETALAAAAMGYEELGHDSARARVDLIRAEIALGRHQLGVARTLALKSLAVLHDRAADAAQVRLVLARCAILDHDQATAHTELEAGLIAARELDLAPLLADLLHLRGTIRLDAGEHREAIDDLLAATQYVERVHGSLQAQRFRMAFLGDRALSYEDLVRAHLAGGGDEAVSCALHAAERCKGRALLEEMRQAIVECPDEAAGGASDDRAALHRRLLEARAELDALYSRIADEQSRDGTARRVRGDLREALREREAELGAIESRLEVMVGRTVSGTSASDATPLVAELTENGVILEFFIARGELMAFVTDAAGRWHQRSLGEINTVDPIVRRLQFQLERGLHAGPRLGSRQARLVHDCERESHRLYLRLLEPLGEFLEKPQRITIIPHGSLHAVPFHLLHDGERYLIERCPVHYAPSLAMLKQLHSRTSTFSGGENEMLVVGVADERAPNIEAEAVVIGDRFGSATMRLGADATVDSVTDAMQTARRIHLACHGSFCDDTPLGSGLKLADGWMTARRLYHLRLKADLVTLSACESGRSRIDSGDELLGLARAILAAGARQLLLTHWKVDDETATELMTRFYEYLGGAAPSPGQTASALRLAQMDLKVRNSHPAFWGPFFLIGPP